VPVRYGAGAIVEAVTALDQGLSSSLPVIGTAPAWVSLSREPIRFLVIAEAEDGDAVTAAMLAASAGGAIAHGATQRAWTGKDFKKMC